MLSVFSLPLVRVVGWFGVCVCIVEYVLVHIAVTNVKRKTKGAEKETHQVLSVCEIGREIEDAQGSVTAAFPAALTAPVDKIRLAHIHAHEMGKERRQLRHGERRKKKVQDQRDAVTKRERPRAESFDVGYCFVDASSPSQISLSRGIRKGKEERQERAQMRESKERKKK